MKLNFDPNLLRVQVGFDFLSIWEHSIVLGSVICASFFSLNIFHLLIVLVLMRITIDLFCNFILKLKKVHYYKEELLLEHEEISLNQLEKFFDFTRKIRLISLSIAILVSLSAPLFEISPYIAFCLAYFPALWAGEIYLKFWSNLATPKSFLSLWNLLDILI